ncbi:MAG TPA: hypothetical protein PLH57_07130 [Oligoflexia bacterium]|nr:hypothetical protein [Oligoflexia bacterium]
MVHLLDIRVLKFSFVILMLGLRTNATAANFDPSTFINATNNLISELGAFVGLAADLRAYEGAKPFSSDIGIDFGTSVSAVTVPAKVASALSEIGIQNVPRYIPIPKVNIQKSLPGNLMIGSEFIPTIKVRGYRLEAYGFNLQWTAIDRPRLPPIAIRAQYNYADLVLANAATYGADLVVSHSILFVHMFAGAGYRYVNANVANPTSTLPLNSNVSFDTSIDAGHFFAGTSLVAGFARITAEADFTTRNVNSYGTKLSFFF